MLSKTVKQAHPEFCPFALPLIFSPLLTLPNDFLTSALVLSCLSRLLPAFPYPSPHSSIEIVPSICI